MFLHIWSCRLAMRGMRRAARARDSDLLAEWKESSVHIQLQVKVWDGPLLKYNLNLSVLQKIIKVPPDGPRWYFLWPNGTWSDAKRRKMRRCLTYCRRGRWRVEEMLVHVLAPLCMSPRQQFVTNYDNFCFCPERAAKFSWATQIGPTSTASANWATYTSSV